MAGIYIHIPFCKQACHYCDFHFSTNRSQTDRMTAAIVNEIHQQKIYLEGETVETIYFGGGTPSLLADEHLKQMLEIIDRSYKVAQGAEITCEANPDDLTVHKLRSLRSIGINRLSIGVQSFNNSNLQFFNRAHNAENALRCITDARANGFDNLSIDLIYGVPGQTAEMWVTDIQTTLALAPQHISCYSLTIEEKTAFGNWQRKGKLIPVSEAAAADQFEVLIDSLTSHGYEHYEVSNFALPGFQSRHNTSYWRGAKYLGVGPSAHSYNGYVRQYNVANNSEYMAAIESGKIPAQVENLSQADQINEMIFTGLRTSSGINLNEVRERHHYDLVAYNDGYIKQLLKNDLAELTGESLKLTRKGLMLADKISSDLFLVGDEPVT